MYSCESGADADPLCASADPCNWSDIHACIRNLLDIHAMYCESHYYGINIVISCGRCIAVKVGQMPIHSVQVPIHASGIGQTSTLVSEICWTSTLCIGNLCYQYINELWPMYSCESGADADPFCASADPYNWSDIHACIRNLLDIHALYWESMLPIY